MILEVKNLNAGYGFLQVLRDISFEIDEGEYVCLIGPNGAGKSTVLRAIGGIIAPISGQIFFNQKEVKKFNAAELGISYISEEMNLFTNMTVHENLLLGAYLLNDKDKIQKRMEFIYDFFPRLAERKKQFAGTMSGGERKLLAIGRGLMSYPKMMLVDEPSFGLAPQMTDTVFAALKHLNTEQKMTILLVEQNVTQTLAETTRGYVLEHGTITMADSSSALAGNEHVRKAYLGV